MLVLHLDAGKLRRDGLHLGGVANGVALLSSFGADVVVQDVDDQRGLLEAFATLAQGGRTFDVVVAVGHSNDRGIRIASDAFVGWPAFAGYLRPFAPRRLLLVACKAGTTEAKEALFSGLPKLRRIYGCPVNARKNLGELLVACAPLVLAVKAPTMKEVRTIQAAAWALTGGQVRQWLRTGDHGDESTIVLDLAAKAADPLLRDLHAKFLRAFK